MRRVGSCSNRAHRPAPRSMGTRRACRPARTACALPPDIDWLTMVWSQALESRDGGKVTGFVAVGTTIDELNDLQPRKGHRAVMELIGRGGLPRDIAPPSDGLHFRLGIAHLGGEVVYPCVVVYSNDEWLATHVVTASFSQPPLIRAVYVVRGPLPDVRVSVLGSSVPH